MDIHPLFDTHEHFETISAEVSNQITELILSSNPYAGVIFEHAYDWLTLNSGNRNNFKTYRTELTVFLNWLFYVRDQDLESIKKKDLDAYVKWCRTPPKELIGSCATPHFKEVDGERLQNPTWKPFVQKKNDEIYTLSISAIRTKLSILSMFYSYLNDEEYLEKNPAASLLRHGDYKKVKHGSADEDSEDIKSMSELQWSYVMDTATQMADEDPDKHERTLFIMSIMYACYTRISEVCIRPGYMPKMSLFRKDKKTGVWIFYVPPSKRNKSRSIPASTSLLDALKRYRGYLMNKNVVTTLLPVPSENIPLVPRFKRGSKGEIAGVLNASLGIRQVREIIKDVFIVAADKLQSDGQTYDADEVREMTPHNIRHTGISHDININNRPLPHVQADAGHDDIQTTSLYLHTRREERYESAKGKLINPLV
jgi:integrase